MGDMQGLVEHMQSIAMQNPERQKDIVKSLEEGRLSIRDWREQLSNIMGMCVPLRIVVLLYGPTHTAQTRLLLLITGDQ